MGLSVVGVVQYMLESSPFLLGNVELVRKVEIIVSQDSQAGTTVTVD
jgi:hypothetical protein